VSSEINELILEELRKISKLLTLIHGDTIERELGKIANTEKRKVMWVLIDGHRMSRDIARIVKVTERAVNKFLREMAMAGFVENPRRKPPKRIIDYVPPSWIELAEKFEEGEKDE